MLAQMLGIIITIIIIITTIVIPLEPSLTRVVGVILLLVSVNAPAESYYPSVKCLSGIIIVIIIK